MLFGDNALGKKAQAEEEAAEQEAAEQEAAKASKRLKEKRSKKASAPTKPFPANMEPTTNDGVYTAEELKAAVLADEESGATEEEKEAFWIRLTETVPPGAVAACDSDSDSNNGPSNGVGNSDIPADEGAAPRGYSPSTSSPRQTSIRIAIEDDEEDDDDDGDDGDANDEDEGEGDHGEADDAEATQPVEAAAPAEDGPENSSEKGASKNKRQAFRRSGRFVVAPTYKGASASMIDEMLTKSNAFRGTVVDPLEAIMNASLPTAGRRGGGGASAGAGAGAVSSTSSSSSIPSPGSQSDAAGNSNGDGDGDGNGNVKRKGKGKGKGRRHKMADHVDSGEQVGWEDSDASDPSPHKAATTLPSMRGHHAPSPLKRSATSSAAGFQKKVRKRIKWTAEEERDLMDGVKKYREHGGSMWNNIRDDPEFSFNSRSNVDLKDKHRNLVKKYGRPTAD